MLDVILMELCIAIWYPDLVLNIYINAPELGLLKQFVSALDKESDAFRYIRNFFPKLSDAKVKTGVFVGPQIKTILRRIR